MARFFSVSTAAAVLLASFLNASTILSKLLVAFKIKIEKTIMPYNQNITESSFSFSARAKSFS